jgi:hypothetical protein
MFLLWWILAALVYDHTESNFLRAESGWYLFLSHSTPAVQHGHAISILTKSFNGHYTPVSFLAEFATAKLIGTQAGFWKWRQITAVALMAAMLFLLVRVCGYALQLSEINASLAAIGLTATLIFQGQMRVFVANPFLVRQICWGLLAVIALLALVQMVRRPNEILWPWLTTGASYMSLQVFGLGAAIVAGTAAALIGIWLGRRQSGFSANASNLMIPLLSMIALTALHVVITLKFPFDPVIAPSTRMQPTSFLMMALGFIPNFLFATVRNLFSTFQPRLTAGEITHDWPYGLAVLLGFGCLVGFSFFRALRKPTARNQTRFVLRTFASVLFLAVIALTLSRAWREPDSFDVADYLIGPRYLVLGTFALAGTMVELIFLCARPFILSAILNIGLAVCAITGNLQYARNVYPKVEPNAMISHARAWQALVAMAHECQRANLAIPNVPLGALTQEFYSWDLKLFEPLLRADLKSPPGISLQFVEWTEFNEGVPGEYDRSVPSLREVKKRLRLKTRK